ncbi:Bax protein [Modicisalibacter ilicicola DSM 19980]|uniref:Bax protein n=1 Tax=Modicisalibacter ilicicola DSM 19980 TaxID=1121942 RepID=A0A1M5BJ09_9GAMM|nr:protein bax [Halomonas ilicicola]SHF42310.1 Bax protein [Halomonas ilicicola DSM 19980]
MHRCRPLHRRSRAASILALTVCLGIAAFPMAAPAEPASEASSQPLQEIALYEQTQRVIDEVDPLSRLPDLRKYPAGPKRKQAFLELLVPIVEIENRRIAAQRQWLLALQSRKGGLSRQEATQLTALCEEYALECSGQKVPAQLLARVNTVPLPLVVVQAVEESGWGTSRFARQGNNLFGLRCFGSECGLAQRGSGRRYQVFDSVRESVRVYLRNLNTHDAYRQLREQRARQARQGRKVTAEKLIATLDNYAVRDDYQDVLLSLLRSNDGLIEQHRSDDTV